MDLLVADISSAARETAVAVRRMVSERANKSTVNGISLLEAKNLCLLTYLRSLSDFAVARAYNLESDKIRNTLVDLRVYLERIRPVEAKLQYRIDKLLKACETRRALDDANMEINMNELAFRPNINSLADIEDEEDYENYSKEKSQENTKNLLLPQSTKLNSDRESDYDDDGEDYDDGIDDNESVNGQNNLYRPPRFAPVHYDDGGKKSDRYRPAQTRTQLAPRLLQSLASEYSNAPEKLSTRDDYSHARQAIDAHFAERQRYEEENYTQLAETKKDKQLRRAGERITMRDEMNELLSDIDLFRSRNKKSDDIDEPHVKNKKELFNRRVHNVTTVTHDAKQPTFEERKQRMKKFDDRKRKRKGTN